ncbi:MAG: hypothetical protein IPK26_30110 [Planctomycetes bacterium]|nr:hypothetical protein [Planctomycetota bacterium]
MATPTEQGAVAWAWTTVFDPDDSVRKVRSASRHLRCMFDKWASLLLCTGLVGQDAALRAPMPVAADRWHVEVAFLC